MFCTVVMVQDGSWKDPCYQECSRDLEGGARPLNAGRKRVTIRLVGNKWTQVALPMPIPVHSPVHFCPASAVALLPPYTFKWGPQHYNLLEGILILGSVEGILWAQGAWGRQMRCAGPIWWLYMLQNNNKGVPSWVQPKSMQLNQCAQS